jgi:hypothetical protein
MQCYVSFTSASYVSIKLNIKQFQSNTYHPESQGPLERLHQTLNNIMNTFCLESQKDRDDGVNMLLFAAGKPFMNLYVVVFLGWFLDTLWEVSFDKNGFVKILLLVI